MKHGIYLVPDMCRVVSRIIQICATRIQKSVFFAGKTTTGHISAFHCSSLCPLHFVVYLPLNPSISASIYWKRKNPIRILLEYMLNQSSSHKKKTQNFVPHSEVNHFTTSQHNLFQFLCSEVGSLDNCHTAISHPQKPLSEIKITTRKSAWSATSSATMSRRHDFAPSGTLKIRLAQFESTSGCRSYFSHLAIAFSSFSTSQPISFSSSLLGLSTWTHVVSIVHWNRKCGTSTTSGTGNGNRILVSVPLIKPIRRQSSSHVKLPLKITTTLLLMKQEREKVHKNSFPPSMQTLYIAICIHSLALLDIRLVYSLYSNPFRLKVSSLSRELGQTNICILSPSDSITNSISKTIAVNKL